MTNNEKWLSYMDGFVSPLSYIEWGWYSMIGAALQRRVWLGPPHQPTYPNTYNVLVGEAGLGKGLVLKQINEFIRFHKLEKPTDISSKMSDEELAYKMLIEQDYNFAEKQMNKRSEDDDQQKFEKPLIFPVTADATTYEALVRAMSHSIRRINGHKIVDGNRTLDIYTHCSMYSCLEELASLFKKRTEDIVHFLLQTYDCGNYEYDTKNKGKDRINKCCYSLLAGTTPSFMQSTFSERLFDEGFSSRTFFIYASKNRRSSFFIPELTEAQIKHKIDILKHLKSLSGLYGRASVDQITYDKLDEWWKTAHTDRVNKNPKLNPYYARKNQHLLKITMAIHFGDNLDMFIPWETFERAMKVLESLERNMHLALALDNANPLAAISKRVLTYIEKMGPRTKKELVAEFWDALPRREHDMDDILLYFCEHKKLRPIETRVNGISLTKYEVIPDYNSDI